MSIKKGNIIAKQIMKMSPELGQKRYRCALTSDWHLNYTYGTSHASNTLETIADYECSKIISCGDIGYSGIQSEWDAWISAIDASSFDRANIHETSGNHDLYTNPATGLELFKTNSNNGRLSSASHPWHADTINGDLFIFVCLENNKYPGQADEFSSTQIDWIEQQIKNYSGTGHIWIVEHAPFYQWGSGDDPEHPAYPTTSGCLQTGNSYPQNTRFKKILVDNPNIIFIHGHTHYGPVTEDGVVVYAKPGEAQSQGGCYSIHIPSIGNVRVMTGQGTSEYHNAEEETYFFLCDVYEHGIVLVGTNGYTGDAVENATYSIITADKFAHRVYHWVNGQRHLIFGNESVTITNNLTHVSNSNAATSGTLDLSYSATLTPDTSYDITSVTVTMDGTDITSTAYNSQTHTISIAEITGDIVITAIAAASGLDYDELNYIAVDGSGQYYDTDLNPDDPKIQITFGNIVNCSNVGVWFAGIYDDNVRFAVGVCNPNIDNSTQSRRGMLLGSRFMDGSSIYVNSDIRSIAAINMDTSGYSVNNVQIDTFSGTYTKGSGSITIFGAEQNGSAYNPDRLAFGKQIGHCKIYDGSTLVGEFVPCKLTNNITSSQASDGNSHSAGEIGVWDTVGDKFHPNKGNGTFLEPNDIPFNELEWIGGNASGQYYDTLLNPSTPGMITRIKDATINPGQSYDLYWFGCRPTSGKSFAAYIKNTSLIHCCFIGVSYQTGTITHTGTEQKITLTAKQMFIDDTKVYTISESAYSPGTETACVMSAGRGGNGSAYSGRASSFKQSGPLYIIDNVTIVGFFIPCELTKNITSSQASDGNAHNIGEVGVWDAISKKFFPNLGGGEFIKP